MLNPKCQVSVVLLYTLRHYFLNNIIYLMISYKCHLLIIYFVGGCTIRVKTNDGQVLNMLEKLSANEEVVMTIIKSSTNVLKCGVSA